MIVESPTLWPNARSPTSNSSDQTLFRCPRCSPGQGNNSKASRNLIVCIDGTSNQFGQNNTNVVKLYAKIDLDSETSQPKQFAYYSSGIGTRPKSFYLFDRMGRAVSDKFDMAVAWNVEEIIKDAYRWLVEKYQEGDKIYLFGFSRGAYQVRVLAGMIHEVGLIKTSTEKQIGTAYAHYKSIRLGKLSTWQTAWEFRNTFSWKGLRVHFVGVWDTVSSVGLIRGDVFLSTSSSATHACHFRHALALDELRVKFMPEYFHEMNSERDAERKYVIPLHVKDSTTPPERIVGDNGTNSPGTSENFPIGDKKSKRTSLIPDSEHSKTLSSEQHDQHMVPDIKEVWFAGGHSDVGGTNRLGEFAQAGNVSLLWMRREAALEGLVLQPTDVVWVPNDLNLGTSKPMNVTWRCVEYFPVKHQVSFSGAGKDARRLHRLQPRRIIPGQKVHTSILLANAYKPRATLGEGLDMAVKQTEFDDVEGQIWETGLLFDNTMARELVMSLENQQEVVALVYLDRLLFMLRSNEGKQCVRAVDSWEGKFEKLIENQKCAPLVRLVTMVAYYEASCDPQVLPQNHSQPRKEPSESAFIVAKDCLRDILVKHEHRDGPRVVALLRLLTKHKDLRQNILSQDIKDDLVKLLDKFIRDHEGNFGQAMDGLNSLLRCDDTDTREFIIATLGKNPPYSNQPRLAWILMVKNTRLQVAALRMVLTLARSPAAEAKNVCSIVKLKIRDLTGSKDRLVGLLAIEIWLAICVPPGQEQEQRQVQERKYLDFRNPLVRANLTNVLAPYNFNANGSPDGRSTNINTCQDQLCCIMGVGASQLNENDKKLFRELKKVVQFRNARDRLAATLTLLKLCESDIICQDLSDLVDVFVKQLQDKHAALLAAYALATCLNYDNMKALIRDNKDLPKYVVNMLYLDYFDDAIGQIQGFQIFGNIMRDDYLREKIKEYRIPDFLERKLRKGTPKDIRTSIICLEIFEYFDQDGSGARELIKKSLGHLRNSQWKFQKVGVTILSALAQTKNGRTAIESYIPEIVGMLLPERYLPEGGAAEFNDSDHTLDKPPSWMMGPVSALCILALNEKLRNVIDQTDEYSSFKHLYLSGMLVGKRNTSPWHIGTPNRTDVLRMTDGMIKFIDMKLSDDLTSFEDTMLPRIRHWDRLVASLRKQTLRAVSILPGMLGVSALAILGVVAATPIVLSAQVYGLFKRLRTRYRDDRFLNNPCHRQVHDTLLSVSAGQTTGHDAINEGETGPREHCSNGSPGSFAYLPAVVPIQGSSKDAE